MSSFTRLLLAAGALLLAATSRVHASVATIQEAQVRCKDNAVVLVPKPLEVNQSAHLEGHGCVLKGQGQHRIMNVNEDVELNVTNATFLDGKATFLQAVDTNYYGSSHAGKMRGTNGGGVRMFGPNKGAFMSCTFQANTGVRSYGGGVYMASGSSILFARCAFLSNTAEKGGSVYLKASNASFSSCMFNASEAQAYQHATSTMGGAAYIDSVTTGSFSDCIFNWNSAFYGGAVYIGPCLAGESCDAAVPRSTTGSFAGCVFHANAAAVKGGGGATYIYDGTGGFLRCTFQFNRAEFVYYDLSSFKAVKIFPPSEEEEFSAGWFKECDGSCTQQGQGGAVYMDRDRLSSLGSFSMCAFHSNAARSGTFLRNKQDKTNGQGGGIYVSGENSAGLGWTTWSQNCTFHGNTAYQGGAVMIAYSATHVSSFSSCTFDSNTVSSGGGGVHVRSTIGAFASCSFTNNTANSGGGVEVHATDSKGFFMACHFDSNEPLGHQQNNDVTAKGGAVRMGAGDTISGNFSRCAFIRNTAVAEGGTMHFGKGGAVYMSMSSADKNLIFSFSDCTVHSNTASQGGGGVRMATVNKGSFSRCSFHANRASTWGGAAVFMEGAKSVLFLECSFRSNAANDDTATTPSSHGGSFHIHLDSSVNFSRAIFRGNKASSDGGALYLKASSAQTGTGPVVLKRCTVAENEAGKVGGGLAVRVTNRLSNPDHLQDGCLQVAECMFSGNRAPLGASIFWRGLTNGQGFGPSATSGRDKESCSPEIYMSLQGSVERTKVFVSNLGTCVDHAFSCGTLRVRAWSASIKQKQVMFTRNCVACPDGKSWAYDSATGLSVCKSCGSNEYVEGNTTTCLPCPKGSFCLDGKRSDCPSGQYSDVLRAASCIACAAGQFANTTGKSRCAACDKGTQQAEPGKPRCESCPAGTLQAAQSSTVCENCEVGQFSASSGTVRCEACEPGMRQPGIGKSECQNCTAGSIQPARSSSSCTSCEDGVAYQDRPGQTICKNCDTCERGYSVNASQICSPASGGVRKQDNETNATIPQYCHRCTPGRFGERTNAPSCTACPPGYSQSLLGRIEICDPCPEGTFAAGTGSQNCTSCPMGHFSRLPSQSACLVCDAGTFARTGNNTCTPCPKGFRSSGGVGVCTGCAAGTYAEFESSSTCVACPKGRVQPQEQMPACESCPEGWFQDLVKQATSCKMCRAGRYAPRPNAELCNVCDDIEREYTVSGAAVACQKCAPNSGVVKENNTCACNDAGDAEDTDEDGAASKSYFEVGFDAGTFPNATASIRACVNVKQGTPGCCRLCPDGGECKGGRMYVRPGYWRRGKAPLGTVELVKCPVRDACPGTKLRGLPYRVAVSGNPDDGLNGTVPRSGSVPDGPCREGHDGPVCADCIDSYKPAMHDLCVRCGDDGKQSNTPKMLVLALGSAWVLMIVTWAVTRSEAVENNTNVDNEQTVKFAKDGNKIEHNAEHTLANAMIMLPFVQRFSAMQTAFSFDWPDIANDIFSWFALAYGSFADAFKMFSPCALHMDFPQVLLAQILATPWMLFLALCVLMLAKCMSRRMHRRRAAARNALVRMRRAKNKGAVNRSKRKRLSSTFKTPLRFRMMTVKVRLISLLLSSIRFLYPGIGSVILKSFRCISIGEGTVLMSMVELPCWSPRYWKRVGTLAVFAVVFIVIGIPIALASVVRRERTWLRRQQQRDDAERLLAVQRLFQSKSATMLHHARDLARDKKLQRRRNETDMYSAVVRRFVRPFKPRFWWWFVLEMLLSLFLIGVLATFPDVGTQVAVGGAAALVQVLLPATLWPFRRKRQNQIAVAGGILYFLNFLSGLAKWMAASAPAARRRAQLASADIAIAVTVIIIVSSVSMVLLHSLLGTTLILLKWCLQSTSLMEMRPGGPVSFRRRKSRVRPRSAKRVSQDATEKDAGEKEGAEDAEEREYEALRPSLERIQPPAWHVVQGAPAALRAKYITKWKELLAVHAELSTVTMQAAARGFLRRRLGSMYHNKRASASISATATSTARGSRETVMVSDDAVDICPPTRGAGRAYGGGHGGGSSLAASRRRHIATKEKNGRSWYTPSVDEHRWARLCLHVGSRDDGAQQASEERGDGGVREMWPPRDALGFLFNALDVHGEGVLSRDDICVNVERLLLDSLAVGDNGAAGEEEVVVVDKATLGEEREEEKEEGFRN